jgi:hypothetical protein
LHASSSASNGGHQLIAGTAWLFARDDFGQALDFLSDTDRRLVTTLVQRIGTRETVVRSRGAPGGRTAAAHWGRATPRSANGIGRDSET